MKIAVADTDGSGEVLVEVTGSQVQVVAGATPTDLVAVLVDPGAYPGRGATFPVAAVQFRAPVALPPSVRDFMAYEDHIKNSLSGLGQTVPPAWYEAPVFYFSNPVAIIGPDDDVRRARGSTKMDYEVEVAAIIGTAASDVDADDPRALDCIAGFTLMNDWSARDLSAREMRHFMGPAKGKDFATSLGPWAVSRDEFGGLPGGVMDERVVARVNGEICTDNTTKGMTFNWPRIIAHASANTTLVPGDVIGSGTVGFGCLLELRTRNKDLGVEKYTFLADGDVVEIESEKFGVLRNTVVA
jgi:2-keto-4-pentenoate hydratase/2-oxohepta-3-ene-1,7-dioic acid hydratase in catechol pathway